MNDLVQRLRDFPLLYSTDGTRWYKSSSKEPLCLEAAAELERLTRELEEARKDAERYRWLGTPLWICELNQYSGPRNRQYLWSTRFSSPLHNENASLGAAIDAAMAQEK